MTAPQAGPQETAPPETDYVLLTDPVQHTDVHAEPALEHIVGGWAVLEDGSYGPFEPNPLFRPSSPGTPFDPFDAASRMWHQGEAGTEALVNMLNDTVLEVAVDESGMPLLRRMPDGTVFATVATAAAHRAGSPLPHWETATMDELGPVLPVGTAVAVNPESAAPVLLHLR